MDESNRRYICVTISKDGNLYRLQITMNGDEQIDYMVFIIDYGFVKDEYYVICHYDNGRRTLLEIEAPSQHSIINVFKLEFEQVRQHDTCYIANISGYEYGRIMNNFLRFIQNTNTNVCEQLWTYLHEEDYHQEFKAITRLLNGLDQ